MRIEELGEGDDEGSVAGVDGQMTRFLQAKMAMVGIGARMLFYPTLAYNVINYNIRPGFHWWDKVDEFLLLGAVPFSCDIPHLKQLGVCGVITLTEPFETLVPTSVYADYGIEHLVIPTRDYLFAPSLEDTCKAVDFIHKNASSGRMTYVHCKAGRGRSTTIVMCYLVKHKQMLPSEAYAYIKKSRPRVLLADAQWQAILRYHQVNSPTSTIEHEGSDDASYIVVSQADLSGCNDGAINVDNRRRVELSLGRSAQIARQRLAQIARQRLAQIAYLAVLTRLAGY